MSTVSEGDTLIVAPRGATQEDLEVLMDVLSVRMDRQFDALQEIRGTLEGRIDALAVRVERLDAEGQMAPRAAATAPAGAREAPERSLERPGRFSRLPSLADRFCRIDGEHGAPTPNKTLVDVLGRGPMDNELGLEIMKPIVGARDECDVPFKSVDDGMKTLDKWERIISLPPLTVETENALIAWEEKAAVCLMGKAVPGGVFNLIVSQQQELVSQGLILRREGANFVSLGEFVQELTIERNFDETMTEQLLLALDRPPRSATVLEGLQIYERVLKRLRRLCRRHSYAAGLTATRLRNSLLAMIPSEVERHLLKQADLRFWTYRETRLAALDYEQRARRADARQTVPLVLAMDENRRPIRCFNCKGEHYKSHCKEPPSRCAKCKQLGHLEDYCRTTVLKDRLGRDRIRVTENKKGYASNVLLDNSKREHLETHKNHIEKELDKLGRRTKRPEENDSAEHMNVAMEEGEANVEEGGEEAEPETEEIPFDLVSDEVHPCFSAFSPAGRGLATVEIAVGGTSSHAILDSGASVSLVSPSDAARFGLRLGSRSTSVRGVKGMLVARESEPCEVNIGTRLCKVDFLVSPEEGLPPIIGGRDIRSNGIDLIYSQGAVHLGPDHDPVPMVLTLDVPTLPEVPACEGSKELLSTLHQIAAAQESPTKGQALVSPVVIPVSGDSPKKVPPRVIPAMIKPKVIEWASKMLEEGSLEPAPEAVHFSPLVFLQKADKKSRMVVDFRERNKTLLTHG